MDDSGGALSHFHAPSLSRKALSRLSHRRRRLKNNTTPVRHSDYMGQLSAKASSSWPDLMLWKFQPVYLRSTDFFQRKGKNEQRRLYSVMAWCLGCLTESQRAAENGWQNPTPFPMKPLAESKRQHVNHSAPNTTLFVWSRTPLSGGYFNGAPIRPTECDCQVTRCFERQLLLLIA